MSRPGSLRTHTSSIKLDDEDRSVNNGANPAFTFIYIAAAEGKTYLQRCNERTKYQLQSCKQYFKRKLGIKHPNYGNDFDEDFIKQYWERKSRSRYNGIGSGAHTVGATSSKASLRSTSSLSSWCVPVEYRARSGSNTGAPTTLTPSSSINSQSMNGTPTDEFQTFSMSNASQDSSLTSSTDATEPSTPPSSTSDSPSPPSTTSSLARGAAGNRNSVGSVNSFITPSSSSSGYNSPRYSIAPAPSTATTSRNLSNPAFARKGSTNNRRSHSYTASGLRAGIYSSIQNKAIPNSSIFRRRFFRSDKNQCIVAEDDQAHSLNHNDFYAPISIEEASKKAQSTLYSSTTTSSAGTCDNDDDEDDITNEESDRLLEMIEQGNHNSDEYVEVSYELINRLAVMNHVEVDIDSELIAALEATHHTLDTSADVSSVGNGIDLDTIPENEEYTSASRGPRARLDVADKSFHGRTRFRHDTVMIEMSLKQLAVFAGKFSHRFNFCISRREDYRFQFYIAGIKEDEEHEEGDEEEEDDGDSLDEDQFDDANEDETQSKHTQINLDCANEGCHSPAGARDSAKDDADEDALLPSFYNNLDNTPQPSDVESLRGNLYGDSDDDDCGTEEGCTVSNTITHSNSTCCDENDDNNASQLHLTKTATLDDGPTQVIAQVAKGPAQESSAVSSSGRTPPQSPLQAQPQVEVPQEPKPPAQAPVPKPVPANVAPPANTLCANGSTKVLANHSPASSHSTLNSFVSAHSTESLTT